MILVFGGAYQGKLDYALERFGFSEDDIYRCDENSTVMPGGKKVIYELDKWILALIKAKSDESAAVRRFIDDNAEAVVICNDISCGVVPVEPELRKWREAAGRALAAISHSSNETVRLFCGIPMQLKK